MNGLYAQLEWLPRPPPDFPARVRSLDQGEGPLGQRIQALAQYALDLNQLLKLATAMERLRARAEPLEALVP